MPQNRRRLGLHPTVGAYSTPPDSLAGFREKCPPGKGGERDGKGRGKRGR